MNVEWTISLGSILTTAMTVLSVLGGWVWFASRLNTRLERVEEAMKQIGEILMSIARTEEQIKGLDQRISDLPCRHSDECRIR